MYFGVSSVFRCISVFTLTAAYGHYVDYGPALHSSGREVRLNLSFVAKNYLYFFPERCDHKK